MSQERLSLPSIHNGKLNQSSLDERRVPKGNDSSYTSRKSSQSLEKAARYDNDDDDSIWQQLKDIKSLLAQEAKARLELSDNIASTNKRLDKLEVVMNNQLKLLPEYMTDITFLEKHHSSVHNLGTNDASQGYKASDSKSVFDRLVKLEGDIVKLSSAADNNKELYDKIATALSDALALQATDINEVKSILSTEITARRKHQNKTNATFERLHVEIENDIFSLRKEMLHISESLGSRVAAAESSAAIHRETMIRQIADGRNYVTDSLNIIRIALDTSRQESSAQQLSMENKVKMELKVFQDKISSIPESFNEKVQEISEQTSATSKLLKKIQQKIDESVRSIDEKTQDSQRIIEERILGYIQTKLSNQEKKLKSTFEQVFRDVSDEISICVNGEASLRSEQIMSVEENLSNLLQSRSEDVGRKLLEIEDRIQYCETGIMTSFVDKLPDFENSVFEPDTDPSDSFDQLNVQVSQKVLERSDTEHIEKATSLEINDPIACNEHQEDLHNSDDQGKLSDSLKEMTIMLDHHQQDDNPSQESLPSPNRAEGESQKLERSKLPINDSVEVESDANQDAIIQHDNEESLDIIPSIVLDPDSSDINKEEVDNKLELASDEEEKRVVDDSNELAELVKTWYNQADQSRGSSREITVEDTLEEPNKVEDDSHSLNIPVADGVPSNQSDADTQEDANMNDGNDLWTNAPMALMDLDDGNDNGSGQNSESNMMLDSPDLVHNPENDGPDNNAINNPHEVDTDPSYDSNFIHPNAERQDDHNTSSDLAGDNAQNDTPTQDPAHLSLLSEGIHSASIVKNDTDSDDKEESVDEIQTQHADEKDHEDLADTIDLGKDDNSDEVERAERDTIDEENQRSNNLLSSKEIIPENNAESEMNGFSEVPTDKIDGDGLSTDIDMIKSNDEQNPFELSQLKETTHFEVHDDHENQETSTDVVNQSEDTADLNNDRNSTEDIKLDDQTKNDHENLSIVAEVDIADLNIPSDTSDAEEGNTQEGDTKELTDSQSFPKVVSIEGLVNNPDSNAVNNLAQEEPMKIEGESVS